MVERREASRAIILAQPRRARAPRDYPQRVQKKEEEKKDGNGDSGVFSARYIICAFFFYLFFYQLNTRRAPGRRDGHRSTGLLSLRLAPQVTSVAQRAAALLPVLQCNFISFFRGGGGAEGTQEGTLRLRNMRLVLLQCAARASQWTPDPQINQS